MNKNIRDYINLIETAQQGVAEGLNEFAPGEGGFGPFKVYISNEFIEEFSTFDQAKEEIEFLRTADPKSFDADWKIIDGTGKIVWQHDPGEAIDAMRMRRKIQFIKPDDKGVAEGSLNEFAPDGFNGGDDDEGFSPEIAKMAQEDGFTKGASLADGATLERAITINHWHNQHGGMYKQYFAKGFKQGRMNKIRHDNKQYNLNLKLMKDGSIRRGEQK